MILPDIRFESIGVQYLDDATSILDQALFSPDAELTAHHDAREPDAVRKVLM